MGRYEQIKQIGEGGMQAVYLSKDHRLQRQVALKIPRNESAEKRFKESAVLSAKVNHPNIAKTLDYFEVDGVGRLVEEFVPGIDLEKWMHKYTNMVDPHLAAHLLHHLSKGLAAVHRWGVIHRDLKPSNILVSDDLRLTTIKITDFGIAKMAAENLQVVSSEHEDTMTKSSTVVGALPYMSPELIDKEESDVTVAADIWSLAALIYCVLAGNPPFGRGPKAAYNILSGVKPSPPDFLLTKAHFHPLGKDLWGMIEACFNFDASDRPTAEDIVSWCSSLCYLDEDRFEGTVCRYGAIHGTWGFIDLGNGQDAFLHIDNYYGKRPSNGTRVALSIYPGFPESRAFPVIALSQ